MFGQALTDIKSMEGQAIELVKNGSKNPAHFLDMQYYSGVHNGFNFVHYVYDHLNSITEEEFNTMFREMMHFNKMKVN